MSQPLASSFPLDSLSWNQGGDKRQTALQLATRLGVVGALAWILVGLESTIRGGEMHYRDALWCVPWVLTMVTFAAVYSAQRSALTRAGRMAAQALGVTMVLVLLGNIGLLVGSEELASLGFPLGVTLWMAAMVSFGVASIRAGVLPRRAGVALILFEPLSLLTGVVLAPIAGLYERGNYSGGIEKGIVLGVILLALTGFLRGNFEHHAFGTSRRVGRLHREAVESTTSAARRAAQPCGPRLEDDRG